MIYQIYGVFLPSGHNVRLVHRATSVNAALAELANTNFGIYDRLIVVSRRRMTSWIEDYYLVNKETLEATTIGHMGYLGTTLGYVYFDPISKQSHGELFWKYVNSSNETKRTLKKYVSGNNGELVVNPAWSNN